MRMCACGGLHRRDTWIFYNGFELGIHHVLGMFGYAADSGHLDILKWLRLRIHLVLGRGHLEVLNGFDLSTHVVLGILRLAKMLLQ